MSDVKQTLKERDGTHGDYKTQAQTSQCFKIIVRGSGNDIDWDMRESLEMICLKIARILHGDPNHADHWRDIEGYARLIRERLNEKQDTNDLR